MRTPTNTQRSQEGAPPPYTPNTQRRPKFSSRNGTANRGGPTTPSDSSRTSGPNSARYSGPAMYPSLANERSGLLNANARTEGYQAMPHSPPPVKRMSLRSIIAVILITSIINTTFFCVTSEYTRDELDPVARERVRREWNKELQNHRMFVKHTEAVRAEWVFETQEHERERSVMVAERRSWQAEREDQEKKLNELHQTIDQDRRNWETEKWIREREWQKRQQDYENEMARKRQREDAKRRTREEEERRRAGMRWEDLFPSQKCLGFGKREYTAQLVDIPRGHNQLSTCRETEAEIHGRPMRPNSCEDRGSGGIWARWIIDFQEPTCTTWWSNLVDKGCTAQGSHIRRFEQHLENIPWGDDWKLMCTTAPTDFHDRHFDSPTSCANWGRHGIFGYWDVGDPSC